MKKITLSLLLVSSLSYATNIEINISNIKPIVGKLSIALVCQNYQQHCLKIHNPHSAFQEDWC
jgi:hypothetical protein